MKDAKARLESTSADNWRIELTRGVIGILSATPRQALHAAGVVADQTRGLRQAEARRMLLIALAHLQEGDEDGAVSVLTGIVDTTGPAELRLLGQLSSRAERLAVERVPGWPSVRHASHPGVLDYANLTPREFRVLAALRRGKSRARIAESLELSENTVKTHLRGLYRKLGVDNADDAVRAALDRRLI